MKSSRFNGLMMAVAGTLAAGISTSTQAADCTQTATGLVPLTDLGAGLYLGQFEGGLYPGGANDVPAAHAAEGIARALAVQPLDAAGNPSSAGKHVLLSIGMSNTTQEFCNGGGGQNCSSWSFVGQALDHPQVNLTTLKIINGAKGGQTAVLWDDPTDANYDRVRDDELVPNGLSEAQVQAVWVKVADAGPTVSLPAANSDAYVLLTHMGNVARALKIRYPNVKVVFLSSRIYAGYATTPLNPEPYAYESGLAVKWLVEAQINQLAGRSADPLAGNLDYNTVAPWIAWGPYLWADGLTPRSDGLIWQCSDLENDGTHPSMPGEQKVGTLLLDFLLSSPFSGPWFTTRPVPPPLGDCNGDGFYDLADHATFANCLAGPGITSDPLCGCTNMDTDADTDLHDVAAFFNILLVEADPAFDNFERPDLCPNWAVLSGGAVGILAQSDLGILSGGIGTAAWQGSSFGPDQFCEGVISSAWNPANNLQLNVRIDAPSGTGYGFRRTGGGYELRRFGPGVNVVLASGPGPALAAGSVMRVEIEGATLRGLVNGAFVLTATDSDLTHGGTSVTLAPLAGAPAAFLESWAGGSLGP